MSGEAKCKLVTDFLQSLVDEVKYRGQPLDNSNKNFKVTVRGVEFRVNVGDTYDIVASRLDRPGNTIDIPISLVSGLDESDYGTLSFADYVIEFFGLRLGIDYSPRFNDLSYWRVCSYATEAPSGLDERFTQTNAGYGTDLHVTPSGKIKSKFRYIAYKIGENRYGVRMLGDFNVAPAQLVLCSTMPELRREHQLNCGYIEAEYHSVQIWQSPFVDAA